MNSNPINAPMSAPDQNVSFIFPPSAPTQRRYRVHTSLTAGVKRTHEQEAHECPPPAPSARSSAPRSTAPSCGTSTVRSARPAAPRPRPPPNRRRPRHRRRRPPRLPRPHSPAHRPRPRRHPRRSSIRATRTSMSASCAARPALTARPRRPPRRKQPSARRSATPPPPSGTRSSASGPCSSQPPRLGAQADLLLDSSSFTTALAAVDLADQAAVDKAITDALERNSAFEAGPTLPGASGPGHQGGQPTPTTTPSLDGAVKARLGG
ncbi:hypothetical protein FHS07_001725 [Microbacterium proteolyticum]|uniref:Uncharacterized protein n=1 Tax=Microbacterium proteolyticum TaxID=1572644 RepID=A0A7W5CJJ9_9MICO|nr:hypothetical protein [Microbacterium proteolyticum]